ncbi:hypothetical protein F5880DRAFT_142684 [Lentinula raphanica]|nr:hypothetical protein F5880DRAFT_142684 [Lentinula raphanica]
MVGANYMGGKRNAAKARVRDSAGRAQKRYFGAQRLNLAANYGNDRRNNENGPKSYLDIVATNGPTKSITDIKFAHARQHTSNPDPQTMGYIPAPIRISPCTPNSRMKLSKLSEDTSSSSSRRTKSSKVLQALDTSEPIALRAAMDKILSLPDLAGVSKLIKRKRRQSSSSSPCPRQESNKRSRVRSPSRLLPSSNDSMSTNVEVSETRQESYSDFEEAIDEPQFNFNVPEEGGLVTNDEHGYYSISTTWNVYPKCPGISHRTRSSDTSSHQSPCWISAPKLDNPISDCHCDNNIFDYEDPWMAVGVMLGIESTPKRPLKKRDIRKVLAEIPTPMSTPSLDVKSIELHPKDSTARYVSSSPSSPSLRNSNPKPSLVTHDFKTNSNATQDAVGTFSGVALQPSVRPMHSLYSLLPYSSDEATSNPPSSPIHAIRSGLPINMFSAHSSETEWQGIIDESNTIASAGSEFNSFVSLQGGAGDEQDANELFFGHDDGAFRPHDGDCVDLDDARSDTSFCIPNSRHRTVKSSPLFTSPLFGTSPYSLSNRELHRQDCGKNIDDIHIEYDSVSLPQEVSLHQRNEGSASPMITPMRFASPTITFDPYPVDGRSYLPDFPQPSHDDFHTPQQRNNTSIYYKNLQVSSDATSNRRLVTPARQQASVFSPRYSASRVRMSNNKTPSNALEHTELSQSISPVHASTFNVSHSPSTQINDQNFTPASSARSDPRTKLSTELNRTLHRAPPRYKSPARLVHSIETNSSTPLARRSPWVPFDSNFNVVRASSPMLSSRPCDYALRKLSNDFNLQHDAPQSEDTRKMNIRSSTITPKEMPLVKPHSTTGNTESTVGREKPASRAALCLSLFADDDVDSDSD